MKLNHRSKANRGIVRMHVSAPRRRGVAVVYVLVLATFIAAIGVTVVRVSRNEHLISLNAQRSLISQAAARGSVHRGVAILRRDPTLLGTIAVRGPEVALGVISNVEVNRRSDGRLVVRSVASYQGVQTVDQVVVDPGRL